MIDVAIIGAPGYAGVELTRLIVGHPAMRLAMVTSSAHAGERVGDVYPALGSHVDLAYVEPDVASIAGCASVAFLAVPHTAAMAVVPRLLESGVTVVDASADFRLNDPATYARWYGVEHTCPELLAEAVYGLPELDRTSLPGARLIACPGCYPTATILAALPALASGQVRLERVVVDAISGVSGAGKTPCPTTHFSAVNESVSAYKVATHRHTPEIIQELSAIAGTGVKVTFTPHLAPLSRGLLSTIYLELAADLSASAAVELYREHYREEPFVTVHPAGVMPATAEVRGTNRAHIGVAVDEEAGMLVAVCAIDNLVKGTSGQAIQCTNIALGFAETAGLDAPGLAV